MQTIIDVLVCLMIADAIFSYFHINMTSPLYKVKEIVKKIQFIYIPIRKIIPPRGIDFSPLIIIVLLNLLSGLF